MVTFDWFIEVYMTALCYTNALIGTVVFLVLYCRLEGDGGDTEQQLFKANALSLAPFQPVHPLRQFSARLHFKSLSVISITETSVWCNERRRMSAHPRTQVYGSISTKLGFRTLGPSFRLKFVYQVRSFYSVNKGLCIWNGFVSCFSIDLFKLNLEGWGVCSPIGTCILESVLMRGNWFDRYLVSDHVSLYLVSNYHFLLHLALSFHICPIYPFFSRSFVLACLHISILIS